MQEQVDANIPLTSDIVQDALDQMRGAVMIVYPMGLPPHDPVKQELENTEDLSGTQVRSKAHHTCILCVNVSNIKA